MFKKLIEEFRSAINKSQNEVIAKEENGFGKIEEAIKKDAEIREDAENEIKEKINALSDSSSSIREKLSKLEKNSEDILTVNKILPDLLTDFKKEYFSKIEDLFNKVNQKSSDVEYQFKQLELRVEQRLIEQHREYSEKLFDILGSFLRWNKEISLVNHLGGNEPDLKKLKIELMRPYAEENWAKKNALQADNINQALQSKGEKIRVAWEKYKDDFLALQREGKDTKFVEAKLEVLNKLMEGANVSNNIESNNNSGDNPK